MLWSIDACQIKLSAEQRHVTIFRAQGLELVEVMCFNKVDRWRSIGFRLNRGLVSVKIVENRAGLFESL